VEHVSKLASVEKAAASKEVEIVAAQLPRRIKQNFL